MEVPQHLASQCSDLQFRMLHIQHPAKHQEFFEMFRKLKHHEIFTDVTFVTKDSRFLPVHRMVLASYSQMMKNIFENAFDLHYKILLPDVEYTDVEALCHILYGVNVTVPRSRFHKIHQLGEMLGIPVSKLRTPEDFLLPSKRPKRKTTPNSPPTSVPEPPSTQKPSTSQEVPPICCWYCNCTFTNLEEFQKHLDANHKDEAYKTKRHKCQKCKKIFPTMWKLRTHLLTHSKPKKLSKRTDHEYAEVNIFQTCLYGCLRRLAPPSDAC